jgi:hypothetical protein
VENYRALAQFYPDRVDFVTSLARALVGAGKSPEAVTLLEGAKARPGSDWDRMRIDLTEGYAYARQANDAAALEAAREAEALASKVGARVVLAEALMSQAWTLQRGGRMDEAEELFVRARAVFVEVRDDDNVLHCDTGLGEVARARGEFEKAIAIGERVVEAYKKAGNLYREAREVIGLAICHASTGHLTRARELTEEGGRIYVEAHDREGEGYAYLNAADLDVSLGNLDGVAGLVAKGRDLHASIHQATGVAQADGTLARLASYQGRLADAEAGYEKAYAEAVATGVAGLVAEVALNRARLAFDTKSSAENARFADADKTVAAASDTHLLAMFEAHASRRALARGDALEARRLALQAEETSLASHAPEAIVLALAAALDASEEGREARKTNLVTRLADLEAVEPKILGLLSLARAARGDEAVTFAERAHETAKGHGLVALALVARRQLAQPRR